MAIALSAYLESLQQNDRFKDCRELYTPTQAQIPLQVQSRKEQKKQRADNPEIKQPEPPREPPVEVLEGLRDAVRAHRQVLLIGKPGSGKTTALRRLVWEGVSEWASGRVDESALPVAVELRELREGTVEDLVRRTLRRHRQQLSLTEVEDLLFDGRLWLLFDGVNELPSANAWAEVSRFRGDYPDMPMIFSTRSLGAGADLGIAHKLEMVPLTEPQMRKFVSKRLPDQANTLLQQLGGRLRELAETPLLLAMLCEVFEQDGQIPRSRGELFRTKFSQQYAAFKPLREQPVSEDFRRLAPELLKHLAFAMMQGDPPTEFRLQIPKAEAETLLQTYLSAHQETNAASRAREYLEDLLEHHLLQLAADPDEVEFHHQLFQEYYAAEALLPKLPNLTDDQLKCHYLNYLKWTEPLAMALALALETQKIKPLKVVELALDINLMLGVRLADKAQPRFQPKVIEKVRQLDIPTLFKVELLEKIQSDAAVPGLLKALKDLDDNVRWRAAKALGTIGSDAAVSGLLEALKDPDDNVRWRAAKALETIGSDAAVPGLLEALKDPDDSVRRRAAKTLETIGSDAAVSGLLEALKDPDDSVRWSVAEALGTIGGDATVAGLLDALKDTDYYVRRRAAQALEKIGGDTAMPGLLIALNDPDDYVRRRAAEALGTIGSDAAVPGLLEALKDPDDNIRRRVAEVLGTIGSDAAVPGLLEALKDPDYYVRGRAAEALGTIGSDAAVPGLLEALKDPDYYVRWSVAGALGTIGSDAAMPGLLEALKDPDDYVRRSAAEALEKIGGDTAVPGLLEALKDSDAGVRRSAAEALEKIGGDTAVPGLLEALKDSDAGVRESAAEALGKIGDGAAIAPLWQARMKHPDERAIGEAIAVIQSRCGFYNYDLYQQAQSLPLREETSYDSGKSQTVNIYGGNTVVQDPKEISFKGASIGAVNIDSTLHNPTQIGTQNNHALDPNFSESLTEILHVLGTLQQQSPTATEE
ncbi:MAG: hypothetical protein OHK0037_32390 [Elainellaceae cyanobacterium]